MIAVDTSTLVNVFKGKGTAAVEYLRQLEINGIEFAIPDCCCMELMQGARDEDEWQVLQEYLSVQRVLTPLYSPDTHFEAARIYFDCRRAGITPRSTIDCLVAQMVLERNGLLIHDDADFEQIRRIRPLQTLSGTSSA